ncbi:unnamed protein product [Ectocarpus sp. 12 AP-2014]
MELDQERVSYLQQLVPDGYTLRDKLRIERQKPRKYRLVLHSRSRANNTELKWRSRWITSRKPRGRDAVAEGTIIDEVTAADWDAVQLKNSAYAPVQRAPPRDSTAPAVRAAAPAVGSLQEPGLAGAQRSRDPNWGGQRDYSGRPFGKLGRAARRMRALTLRQELEEAVPGAFNLSASSLEEVVRAWIEFEPEWAEEAKRRYLNKGTYSTSQAAKKIRRAKGAEMKARVLAAAAGEFRAESIELLDGVVRDVAKTISAAAEMDDDTSTEDSCLSNFQLAHTVQVAMTLIQLYTQQADGFDRKDALRHGGACLMLPKYHCECNPIELVWGRAKDWTRKNCKYSLECLRKNVPLSFRPEKDRQAVSVVQGYCKKAYTHALMYRETRVQGPEGKKTYKKCKSHRRPTPKEWRP